MIRRHLSRFILIILLTGFTLVSLILVAGAAFALPLEVQPATPIPLVQTLNARMAGVFRPEGTPIPDELDELIAELPKSRTEDGAFVLGDPDAPFTMVLFTDYLCPHCQEYYPTVLEFIRTHVASGDAALEVRIFPTAGRERTVYMANATACMEEQQPGIFWTAFRHFFDVGISRTYSDSTVENFVDQYDLTLSEVLACTSESERVTTDVAFGYEVGISSTPSVLMRFGDAEPVFIEFDGVTYNRPVPIDILDAVVRGTES